MLSCADFADRLYDEDCRRALAGRGAVPPDAELHRAACEECRRLWIEAAEDLAALPPMLIEQAPATLTARLHRDLSPSLAAPVAPWKLVDWTAGIIWAGLGAALGILVASQLAGFAALLAPGFAATLKALPLAPLALFGASLAFAASTARQVLREAPG